MLSTDGLQESSNLCFIIYKLYRKNLINSDKWRGLYLQEYICISVSRFALIMSCAAKRWLNEEKIPARPAAATQSFFLIFLPSAKEEVEYKTDGILSSLLHW